MSDESNEPKSESLDADEIAQVAEEVHTQAEQAATPSENPPEQAKVAPTARAFNFRQSVILTDQDNRILRSRQNDFIAYFSAKLSAFFRMEFTAEIQQFASVQYSNFLTTIPSATHITLFSCNPLPGLGILEMSPRIAISIADRLLGGKGVPTNSERSLTDIEIGLVDDVILIILDEWCQIWKSEIEAKPSVVGHEKSAEYLQTASKDSNLYVLTLDIKFGGAIEPMQLAVPFGMLESIIKKIQLSHAKVSTKSSSAKATARITPAHSQIQVPVTAQWPGIDLSIREVAGFRVGDIIEMPASVLQETRLLLNGSPKFSGVVGFEGDSVAIQIVHKTTS